MAKVKSEYEVESLLIDRLQELEYEYVDLKEFKRYTIIFNIKNLLTSN